MRTAWYCGMLLAPLVAFGQVYEADNANTRSFSDKPQTVEQASEHADRLIAERQRNRAAVRRQSVTDEQRRLIVQHYEATRQELLELEEERLTRCGKHPTRGFAGEGPRRDRWIEWERCEKGFADALAAARTAERIAYRNYLSVK